MDFLKTGMDFLKRSNGFLKGEWKMEEQVEIKIEKTLIGHRAEIKTFEKRFNRNFGRHPNDFKSMIQWIGIVLRELNLSELGNEFSELVKYTNDI